MIKKIGRFLSILVIASIFISLTFVTEVNAIRNMPEGTEVSGISLANKNEKEAIMAIEQEIKLWESGDDLIVRSDYQELAIPREAFTFDLNATIAELKKNMKRKWTSFFKRPKDVTVTLFVTVDHDHYAIEHLKQQSDYIDSEKMLIQLENYAGELKDDVLPITYIDEENLPFKTVTEIELDYPNLSDVIMTYILNNLDEQTIFGHDSFSVLETVDFNESIMTSTDELDFIGSALYTLFLETNFPIVERHAQLNSPKNWRKGTDVALSYKEHKDLIVINPNSQAFKIIAEETSDKIKIQLKAIDYDITASYTIEEGEVVESRTIYRYSKDMKPGDYVVIQSGQDGATVNVYREIEGEKERVSEDVYLPVPRVVLAATRDAVPESERDDIDDEAIIIGDAELEDKLDEVQQLVEDLQYLITFYDYYLDALMIEYEDELIDYTTLTNNVEQLQEQFEHLQDEKAQQIDVDDFLKLQTEVEQLKELLDKKEG